MGYSLEDLADIEELKNLCDSFTEITGVSTAIVDPQGKFLVATAWQDICAKFHRANPESAKWCVESDTVLAADLERNKKCIVYKCKNGLMDVVSPIIVRGMHVANLFTGQFLLEPPDMDYFRKQAAQFGFDEISYLKALSRVPVYSEEKVRKISDFLCHLAEIVAKTGLARLELLEKNDELRREISERKAAEEALKINQTRQNLAMNMANLVQWEYDFENDLFTFDDQFYALYGTTADQQGGTRMPSREYAHRFLPVEKRNMIQNEIAAALAATEPNYSRQIEHRIIRADGRERDIIARYQAIKDINGRTIKLFGANQDVTELKQAEKSLEESESTLRAVFEGVKDGILVADIETQKFIIANPEICRMLGYSLEEMLRLGMADIHPQESLSQVLEQLRRHPGDELKHLTDIELKRKDGSIFLGDTKGKRVEIGGRRCVVGVFRDITPRKMVEKALHESEELYRLTFDRAPVGVAHIGLDGKYILVNQRFCEIVGYSRKDLLGLKLFDFTHTADVEEGRNLLKEMTEGRFSSYDREKRFIRKDGTIAWAHVSGSLARDDKGRPEHFLTVIEDITDRKKSRVGFA